MNQVIKHNTPFTVTYRNIDYKCYVRNVGYTFAELSIKKIKKFKPKFFFGLELKYTVDVFEYNELRITAMNREPYYDVYNIRERIKAIINTVENNKKNNNIITKHFNII